MFSRPTNSTSQSAVAQAAAINKSQAVIEFNVDGSILTDALRGLSSQVGRSRADTKAPQ